MPGMNDLFDLKYVYIQCNLKKINKKESRQVIMDSLCSCLKNLLTIEINFDESKTDIRLELVGKVLSELMDVLERKNIVR